MFAISDWLFAISAFPLAIIAAVIFMISLMAGVFRLISLIWLVILFTDSFIAVWAALYTCLPLESTDTLLLSIAMRCLCLPNRSKVPAPSRFTSTR